MRLLLSLLLLSCWLQPALAAPPQPRETPFSSDPLTALQPHSRLKWQDHVAEAAQLDLQPGCQPYYLAPKGPVKGAVILLHGFTACPQQNDGLAPLMAAEGYHVLVPLLPGHGRRAWQSADGKWHDNLKDMPRRETFHEYRDFSRQLAELVKDEPGQHLILGASMGGAVAGSAMLQSPRVFDRGMILAPLFDIPGPQNVLVPGLAYWAPEYQYHWGPICDQERSKHRGGYCEFGMTHVRAMQAFGLETLEQLKGFYQPIQMVGVEGDDAASNAAILQAAQQLPIGQTCLFVKGTSHSMLSPYDNQHQEKPWLESLQQQTVRFLTSGQHFQPVGPSLEQGFQRCQSR